MSEEARTITVIGPERRVDVSLPAGRRVSELLVDLLPLLDGGGSGASDGRLALLAGRPLDLDRSLAEQGVLDGAVLLLRSGRDVRSLTVHDRARPAAPSDAAERGWRPARWRTALTALAALLVAGGGIGQLVAGSANRVDAAGLLGAACLVAVTGAVASRGLGQPVEGALLALAALAPWLAGAVGLAGVAGLPLAWAATVGLGAVAVGAVAAILLAGDVALVPGAALVIATGVPALVLAVGAALGAAPGAATAVLVPVALGLLRPAPTLAARSSGLLATDLAAAGPAAIASRIARSRRLLTATTAGAGAIVGASSVALALTGGGFGGGLAAAAGSAAILEARHFGFTRSAVPLVLAGLAGLTAAIASLAALAGAPAARPALVALLLGTAVAAAAAGVIGGRRELPASIRVHLGKLEAAAAVAIGPLAFGVIGVYPMAAALARHIG